MCSRAETECEPRVSNLISLLASQEEVAKQQQLLIEEVCAGDEVTGDGRQEECEDFVNQQWPNIMAAIAQEGHAFAKNICYSLEVR